MPAGSAGTSKHWAGPGRRLFFAGKRGSAKARKGTDGINEEFRNPGRGLSWCPGFLVNCPHPRFRTFALPCEKAASRAANPVGALEEVLAALPSSTNLHHVL